MRVTVLGTGIMGVGMTHSLLRAGHDVRVWNRTAERAAPLEGDGATVFRDAKDAVRGSEAVVTILYDADAVLEVVDEVAPELANTVWVQAATIGLEGTRRVAQVATSRGLTVVDAPVLGTKDPAERGALVPIVSGEPDAVRRAAPVFDAIGSKTIHVGTRVGQASALKLCCNAWTSTLTVALAQSLALTEHLGLDPALFLEAIEGGVIDVPLAHDKGASMLRRDYPTAFALDGAVKDVGLMLEAAREGGVPDDLLTSVHRLYGIASARGSGAADMAAVFEAFRSQPG